MPTKRLTVLAMLLAAPFFSAPLHATVTLTPAADGSVAPNLAAPLLGGLAASNPASMLAQATLPAPTALSTYGAGQGTVAIAATTKPASASDDAPAQDQGGDVATDDESEVGDLRHTLIALAMRLRDVRYVRGGKDPSHGFDCSGFVRYVFSHAIGLQLPTNSASQFVASLKINRGDMQPGDLVFFHTGGRRHRISHVGIYIDNGQFIHSPSRGKTVEVSSLSEAYWARHFAGARRPEGIVQS